MDISDGSTVETCHDATWCPATQVSVVSKVLRLRKPLSAYPQMLFFSTGDPSLGVQHYGRKTSIRRGHFSPPEIDQRGCPVLMGEERIFKKM